MMMLEFSIFPVGSGESLSSGVVEALDEVERSGLAHEITDMGTTVEGSTADCLRLVRRCVDRLAEKYNRVACTVKIDYRKGEESRLGRKQEKVKKLLINKRRNDA